MLNTNILRSTNVDLFYLPADNKKFATSRIGFVNYETNSIIVMNEEFLQYIWGNNLFHTPEKTECGKEIKILSTGELNKNSGPDFFNAKIKIDDTTWAGNVEIHTNASNWYNHKHHINKAYNNTILHVVEENDSEVCLENGAILPAVKITYDNKYIKNYINLITQNQTIKCAKHLKNINGIELTFWLQHLVIDRIIEKTEQFNTILQQQNSDWEESFYIFIARYFGFNVNTLPFQLLAQSTPQKILAKYRTQKQLIEAILFGQSGLLETSTESDDYANILSTEYQHIKNKHNLTPIEPHLWKFMRMRPIGYPTIRISQFADLINKSQNLFSKIIETETTESLIELLNCKTSEYWTNHHIFGKESKTKEKPLGKSSVYGIIINVIVPTLFAWGEFTENTTFKERGLNIIEKIPSEKNSIIELWKTHGIKPQNGSDTQALLHLYNKYCKNKNCVNCRIGHLIIKK